MAELVGVLASLTIGVGYLLAPLMGGDLSAQLARADFATAYPLTPVALQWFGGFLPFGYSTWVPWVMGTIGVRLTGVLATVVATWLTARLFVRTGARRATWGATAAAITLGSNLIEGRVTFACGIACGLAALLTISRRGAPAPDLGWCSCVPGRRSQSGRCAAAGRLRHPSPRAASIRRRDSPVGVRRSCRHFVVAVRGSGTRALLGQ